MSYSIPPSAWGDLTGDVFGCVPWKPLPYRSVGDLPAVDVDAFGDGQYVRLGDGSKASWDGRRWQPYPPEPVEAVVQDDELVDVDIEIADADPVEDVEE